MVQLSETKYYQLNNNSFADHQVVQKVTSLLNDLRSSLVNNKLALTKTFELQLASSTEIQEEYETKIDSISGTLIP